MIRRIGSLVASALLLLLTTACFEVDNRLVIHPDGRLTHTLRIGQPKALVATQHPATSSARWEGDVASAVGTWAKAWVDQTPDTRWYVLQADLGDLAAYDAYRSAFLEGLKQQNKPYTWTAPPTITPRPGEWLVQVDEDGAGTSNTVRTDPDHPLYYTLTIEVPELGDHNADRDEGTTVVWERPTGEVMQRGLKAWASVPRASPWHLTHLVGGGALVLLVAGAAVAFGVRRGDAE